MKNQKAAYSVIFRITKLLAAVIIIMLIYIASLKSYDFGYRIFSERPVSMAPGMDVTVEIKSGMNTDAISNLLEEKGVIRDALIFKIQNRFSHYHGEFQAGTYTLNTSMDNEEIMAILSGEVSQE
jgi:UPF0755 protein